MCSALPTLAEPWNMTCSNRCANPVLPTTSCLEPTLYQTLTATTGARWSSATMRRRPLARRSSLNSTTGTGMRRESSGGGGLRPIVWRVAFRPRSGCRAGGPLDNSGDGVRLLSNTSEMTRTPMVSTTRTPRQSLPTTGRAMLRDVGSGATWATSFDVRTAFDFAVSLAREVGEQDELPDQDRRWLERSRSALPEALRPLIDDELTIFGAGLLIDRPDITDAAGFLALL